MRSVSGRRHWILDLTILIVALLLFWWSQYRPVSVVDRVENNLYDMRFRVAGSPVNNTQRNDQSVQVPIVIVEIDEYSLGKTGRWPWSRSTLTTLLKNLQQQGVMITAFDLSFSEPEQNVISDLIHRTELAEVSDFLHEVAPGFDVDRQLAQQISSQDVILGYILHTEPTKSGRLPEALKINSETPSEIPVPRLKGYAAPLPLFSHSALGAGFLTTIPDSDGVIRRVPMVLAVQDQFYTSLSLEVAKHYLLVDEVEINTIELEMAQPIVEISLGGVSIPTADDGSVLVPYKGGRNSFYTVSAADLLSQGPQIPELKNAIAMVGFTALGLGDLKTVPLQTSFPGIEVHANIVDAVVNQRAFPHTPYWATSLTSIVMLVLGGLLIFLLPRLSALWMPVTGLALLVLLISGNYLTWVRAAYDLPLFVPALMIIVLTFKAVLFGFLNEQAERRLIKSFFGSYVAPTRIEQMMRNPGSFNLEGERKEMTVMFADIRGFTEIAEQMDVQQLKQYLNQYLTPVTGIIFANNGTIDKYVGDMIMAFWGAPVDDKCHAENAVRAALQMIECVEKINKDFVGTGMPPIKIGIGINTGEMNVGDMGSEFRRSYTVIGDSVNLASRLEALTGDYGVDILLGAETREACRDWPMLSIDRVRVKGKKQAVEVFTPAALPSEFDEAQSAQLSEHNTAVAAYLNGDLNMAEAEFRKLEKSGLIPHYYSTMLDRIAEHQNATS